LLQSETCPDYLVETFPVGPLRCNCTIVGNPKTRQAIVIDPGGDADKILALLTQHNYTVCSILHTHAHFDHFLASGIIHQKTGAPLCLHAGDKPLWQNLERQCSLFGIPYTPVPDPTHWVEDDEPLEVLDSPGRAIHTPGHTPGSMSFLFEEINLLVAGDTLFKGSVGRTDLWGGDFTTLKHSIQKRLYTLDESLCVIPGHGASTTIGEELRYNPVVSAVG
jgi:hydroxyacylglutathione hydrolase